MKAVLDRHALDYELEWTGHGKPFLTPRGRLVEVVADTVRDVCGVTPELSCTGGTSDGRFIADICREVVELGPVNATIHKHRMSALRCRTSSRCRLSIVAYCKDCLPDAAVAPNCLPHR